MRATIDPDDHVAWATADLRPRIDVEDKDAVWEALDRSTVRNPFAAS